MNCRLANALAGCLLSLLLAACGGGGGGDGGTAAGSEVRAIGR